jgi:hypothetical protein
MSAVALRTYGFAWIDCSNCGVTFAITNDYEQRRREDKRSFYCPNGHTQFYPGETGKEREIRELKEKLRLEESRRANAESSRKWAEQAAQGARIAAGKAKAAKNRLLHRVNCGVCPHCKRTFKQLAAHMKTKHPEQK